jgi:hypothetical protein
LAVFPPTFVSKLHIMKKSKKGINVLDQSYDSRLIIEQLQPLSIYRERDQIITKYNGNVLASSYRSEKYGLLDFGNLVQENLSQIEATVQPVKYDLNINYGVQQLKIYSDTFKDDGEIYQRMFTLFSSSNGTYPMLFNMGLFRQICSNGLMIHTANGFETKTKHYAIAIQNKIQLLHDHMPQFLQDIDLQLDFIRSLKKEEISLRQLYSGLLDSKENEPKKNAIERVNKFGNKLLTSPSDAVQKLLDEKQIRSLTHPLELALNKETTKDLMIPKIQAFNCYTEVFNRRLQAVNFKENKRIKELLMVD